MSRSAPHNELPHERLDRSVIVDHSYSDADLLEVIQAMSKECEGSVGLPQEREVWSEDPTSHTPHQSKDLIKVGVLEAERPRG